MNLQAIEKLLEKYFNGDTSLQEERELRKFFSTGQVPPQWQNLAAFFTFTEEEKEVKLSAPGFDERVTGHLEESRMSKLMDFRRPWIYWVSGLAAGILLLIAIFVKFDPFSGRIGDTYDNPEVAYMQAKKVLLFVSSKMSDGTSNLEPVGKFSQGLSEVQPVASYDKSLNNIGRISEVDKVKDMISTIN